METTIESIISRFNVEKKDVDELYKKQLKENVEVIGLPQKEAERLAIDQVSAMIARRKISGRDAFQGVIIGTDGRVTNWADIARKAHAEKIKGMTVEEQVRLGYSTSDGKPCYINDKFRTGAIPKDDYRIQYFGIFKDDGKWKYTVVNLKSKDEMSKMPLGNEVKLEAFKTSASTEDYLNLSISDVRYEVVDSPEKTKVKDYYERIAKKVGISINSTEQGEMRNKLVYVKSKILREVRYGVGTNKSTLLSIDYSDERLGIDTITVWMPAKENLKTIFREMLPINILMTFSGYDAERRQFIGNGVVAWYDDIYEPKEVQPPVAPAIKKTEDVNNNKTTEAEEDDVW